MSIPMIVTCVASFATGWCLAAYGVSVRDGWQSIAVIAACSVVVSFIARAIVGAVL